MRPAPNTSPSTSRDVVLRALAKLSESDLTHRVIIPLIKSWGYKGVEYFGGPNEKGKDIIAWRNDDLGDQELTVAQVKKYKPSARAADQRSFSALVSQIVQAFEEPVPAKDGHEYIPVAI